MGFSFFLGNLRRNCYSITRKEENMQEHSIIELSKILKEKHQREDELKNLKNSQIKKAVENCGVTIEEFLKIKEEIRQVNKESDFVERSKFLEAEIEAETSAFYEKVAEATEFMIPDSKGEFTVKLADCTVKYSPKPKYLVLDMDEDTKLAAIQKIIASEFWDALSINEDKYIELNELLKEQTKMGIFRNCPGIIDRDFFLKDEFSVRKASRKK